ncbi:MAG: helix-turn-helix domain-containing protein [Betaproteobacteria bacterium]|nr:helix-turn-helix domain-containing protein [Betaproteobacteria bacterium]
MTYHQLTQEERYRITAYRMCGHCPATIARLLGRHRSTISRQLRRNATNHDGGDRARPTHQRVGLPLIMVRYIRRLSFSA